MDKDITFLRAPTDTPRVVAATRIGGTLKDIFFPVSSIQRIEAQNADASVIVLTDGLKIPVGLAADALDRKIYNDDLDITGRIDLMTVTGAAAERAVQSALVTAFNDKARAERSLNILINGFGGSKEGIKFQNQYLFNDKYIQGYEDDATFGKSGEIGFIRFKDGASRVASDRCGIFFYMNYSKMCETILAAKKCGEHFIDLREETKPPADMPFPLNAEPKVLQGPA